jgi:D-alanyl-D-alanine carboxypeptidase
MPNQQLGTTQLRELWCQYACKGSEFNDLGGGCAPAGAWSDPSFMGKKIGGTPTVAVDAYKALEQALRSEGYEPEDRCKSVWSYNCRPIASSGNPSLHSYGIAIDIDPSQNPQTSGGDPYSGWLKKNHVDAVMRIKVNSGKTLWWWGGYWTGSTMVDRMHFQLDVPPSEANKINWGTVPGGGGGDGGDDLAELSTEAQRYFQEIYEALEASPSNGGPQKPSGESNPPGSRIFVYLTNFHRWATKKTGKEGTEYDQIVARFMQDKT